MALFMIATIMNRDNIIGVRILDTDTEKTKDISIESTKNWISEGGKVENLGVDSNSLVGTNGSIKRYAQLDVNGKLIGTSGIVIINRVLDQGFTIADYQGNMARVSNEKLIRWLSRGDGLTLANGKEVSGNISSIRGEYDIITHVTAPVEIKNKDKKNNKNHKDYIEINELVAEISDAMGIKDKDRAIKKAEAEFINMPSEIMSGDNKIKLLQLRLVWIDNDNNTVEEVGFAYKEWGPSSYSPTYTYQMLDIMCELKRIEINKDKIKLMKYSEIKNRSYKDTVTAFIRGVIAAELGKLAIDEHTTNIRKMVDGYKKDYANSVEAIKNQSGILTSAQFRDILTNKSIIPTRYELDIYPERIQLTFYGDSEKYVCDRVSFTYEEYDHNWFMRDIDTLDSKSKAEYNNWLKRLSKGKVNFKNCDKQKESLNCGDKFSLNYQHIVVYNINGEYTKEEAERIASKINSR